MEKQRDFLPSAIHAGLCGGGILPILYLPVWFAAFRLSVTLDAWLRLGIDSVLVLWWLGCIALLPPTRPLWRAKQPGFSRHAAPVLCALSISLTVCRIVFALLMAAAQPHSGAAGRLFCALAAWGALLWGQGLCTALLPCFRGKKALGVAGAVLTAAWLTVDLLALAAP